MLDPALSDTVVIRIDRFRRWLPQLVSAVAEIGGVEHALLIAPSRKKWLATLRAAVVLVAHDEMGKGWSEIGRALGRRDHTAMIASYRKAQHGLATSAEFRQIAALALAVARTIAGRKPLFDIEPELPL